MNGRAVAWYTAFLLTLTAALLLIPAALAIYEADLRALRAYLGAFAVNGVVAAVCWRLGRHRPATLHRKDAIGIVAATWLAIGVLGALPMMFEGAIPRPSDALFEAVSGFTTTGATVVADVDGLSNATNLWRCLMHWVGGMGIVVLFVAVFPQLGVGAKQLFRNEVPGPITEGLRPRIRQTALALWWTYATLTAVAIGCLLLAGMPVYDAVCHALSTLGTGGFSTKSASVGGYNNAAVDWIISVFMLIAGLNFGLYYLAVRGDIVGLFRNYEARFYLAMNVAVIAVLYFAIRSRHDGVLETLRFATFQTLAVTTTTGFMTEDFDTYPDIARFVLFLCMFVGGCAGSTAGGLKASRVFAIMKVALRELRLVVQPQVVVPVRTGSQILSTQVISGILVFMAAYFLLFVIASGVMVALGLDLISAMSAVVACLSSIGPGLSAVGPSQNFAFIPAIGKLLLCVCMIAGRLEIFALFAILHPETWRR